MEIYKYPSGPYRTNAYLIVDQGKAVVIDPSKSSIRILHELSEKNIQLEKILLTHSHWDHIIDAKVLKEKTGAPLYVHALDAANVENPGSDLLNAPVSVEGVKPDFFLTDGQKIEVGSVVLEVIHTPGHSHGSVSFYSKEHKVLFSGDLLFSGSIGRSDLPTSNPDIIWQSLERLALLPKETKVYPGHGPETEIGKEL